MENRLKPETCEVISRLKDAYIRTIMCTGDNILTALSVAHDCDMIDDDDIVVLVQASKENDEIAFSYAEKSSLKATQKSNVKIGACLFLKQKINLFLFSVYQRI